MRLRLQFLSLSLLGALFGMGLIIPNSALARPVSYPGGWTFITENDGDANAALVHYSPTAKTALGYRIEYRRDSDFTIHALQMNNLLKRWNNPDSQANIYLNSGIGFARSDAGEFDGHSQAAGFIGFATDWEDRRYFASYKNRITEAGDLGGFFAQSARLGWAPYEGDYGDLHSWIMLDVKHTPVGEHDFSVTPMVRLFKDVHLLEAGISNHGEILFNYIFRY